MGAVVPVVVFASFASIAFSQASNRRSAPDLVAALESVSEQFDVPLGLEYRVSSTTTRVVRVPFEAKTISEALTKVVRQVRGYQWQIKGGVAHVFEQSLIHDRRNPLNVMINEKLPRLCLTTEASTLLMQAAEERVTARQGGGRGGSFPSGVGEPRVTLKTHHAPLRQYLNELVRVSRAGMWVVSFPQEPVLTPVGFFEVAPSQELRMNGQPRPALWTLRRWRDLLQR